MELIALVLVAVVVAAFLYASKRATPSDWESPETAAYRQALRKDAEERQAELLPRIAVARGPAEVLALCDHRPPLSMRLLKSEQAVWVVPDCEYLKTKTEVMYRGRSTGVSFRILIPYYMHPRPAE